MPNSITVKGTLGRLLGVERVDSSLKASAMIPIFELMYVPNQRRLKMVPFNSYYNRSVQEVFRMHLTDRI